ncbi:MAG: hypothetical protein IPP48_06165 [Chitinophagaceae bacterium]|nr:hypothetical protein [Chitinophagaceae bacterium]
MLTVDDFITKFSKYSDQELFEVYQNIEGYSEHAKMALAHVIETKGGLNRLTNSIVESQQFAGETQK